MAKNQKMLEIQSFLNKFNEENKKRNEELIQKEIDSGICDIVGSIERCWIFGCFILIDILLKIIEDNKTITKKYLTDLLKKFENSIDTFEEIKGLRTKQRLELENRGKISLIKLLLENFFTIKKQDVTILKEELQKDIEQLYHDLKNNRVSINRIKMKHGITIKNESSLITCGKCTNINIICEEKCNHYREFLQLNEKSIEIKNKINEKEKEIYEKIELPKILKKLEKEKNSLLKKIELVKKQLENYLKDNNIQYLTNSLICKRENGFCCGVKIACQDKSCKNLLSILQYEKEIKELESEIEILNEKISKLTKK